MFDINSANIISFLMPNINITDITMNTAIFIKNVVCMSLKYVDFLNIDIISLLGNTSKILTAVNRNPANVRQMVLYDIDSPSFTLVRCITNIVATNVIIGI
ncbi:hypothetical protein [Peptostreptococcus sp.]|jgi:hypothetical protein|uniref:hypothetical protein n=1 Tax=Peptostreptococcus sp. TaxID=1262 RepID=UPI001D507272|nr:hypothetical protein [Peptostreptococcus sp.]MBS5595845.1 hypothetical protein [Peptostreptococcus sp.]